MLRKLFIFFMVILLAGCTPSGSANFNKEDYKNISDASNEFAFDLLFNLLQNKEDEEGNLFISPISIHLALAMTYNGANSETKEEMAKVLNIDSFELEEINRAYASFLNRVSNRDYGATLNIANSIWIQKGYPFLDSFKKNVKDYYRATVEEVEYTNPATKDKINNWVADATNQKIKDMLTQIRPDTVAYLINAIYFKGDWKHPFKKEQTYQNTFFTNSEQINHDFMYQDEKFSYFQNDLFQGISLPYENDEMSMYVLLPNENKSLEDFYKEFSFVQWNNWKKQFSLQQVQLKLPKFQFEYEVELNDALIELGMPTAFTNYADFSQMVKNGGIKISEVKHKSFVLVNEEGTEAAAATSVGMVETAIMESVKMTVNRPFVFLIEDNDSGLILFIGEVNDPRGE